MLIRVKGVEEDNRSEIRQAILNCMHQHGIHYRYWTFDWGGPVELTQDDGKWTSSAAGIIVELPGTEAIRLEVPKGLLEDISRISGLFLDAIVFVVMAPIEASYRGQRL